MLAHPALTNQPTLKAGEGLAALGGPLGDDPQHVEAHRLGQGAALADDDGVALPHPEGRGDVGGHVLVPLLVPLVLLDEVEVVPADNERAVHFSGRDGAGQDAAPDGDRADKGALLVNVGALDGLGGREERRRGGEVR